MADGERAKVSCSLGQRGSRMGTSFSKAEVQACDPSTSEVEAQFKATLAT